MSNVDLPPPAYDGQQTAGRYLAVQVVHDRMTGITERQVVKMSMIYPIAQ